MSSKSTTRHVVFACCHAARRSLPQQTDPVATQKKVGLDWPHPQEARKQYHKTGSDLESTREENEGKTQEHMAHRHRGRNVETQSLLEGAGEDGCAD